MSEKKNNAPEKTPVSDETTSVETPFVVMGELLLRALERSGVVVDDDDRTLVAGTMRLLAAAMEAGSLCIAVPKETCSHFEKLGLAASGNVFSRKSLTEDVRRTLILDESASVPFVHDEGGRLYPQRFFLEELTLAQRFCRLAAMPASPATSAQTGLLDAMAAADRVWVESTLAPELAPELRARRLAEAEQSEADQRAAVLSAVTRRFTVVCGGPGTGKTTSVVKMLLLLFLENPSLRVSLAAPTGKATSRMMQSVSDGIARYARLFDSAAGEAGAWIRSADLKSRIREHTIHKWLTMPVSGASRPSASAPMETDVLVVDEASMIDVGLASRLFAAVDPERTRVIVLGDPYQLAAVGPGAVYADLADENGALRFCRAFLTVSRRYGAASPVGRLARLVNDPDTPAEALDAAWEAGKETKESGAEHVRCAPAIGRGGEISAALREWMRRQLRPFVRSVRRMVEKEAFDDEDDYRSHADAVWRALSHFRLLAAQRAGRAGVTALNEWAGEAVSSVLGREGSWFPGFVLIVRTNDDTIGLFNGDVGVCLPDPENPAQTIVWFGDKGPSVKDCAFAPGLLPRFDAAYAMTIHQSQGSEFDEVAIILPEDAESGLATRELLYTGITRAKRGAVIFGRKEVFLRAASTPTLREGGLSDRLREFQSASYAEAQNARQ